MLTFRPLKTTFRTIQPNPSYDVLLMPFIHTKLHAEKEKSFWSISEIGPSPLKVDADK